MGERRGTLPTGLRSSSLVVVRVHLPRIGIGPYTDLPVDTFEWCSRVDRIGSHQLTDDPNNADLILFTQCHMVDWRLRAIREHPVARAHWDRVAVYDERDRPWRSFPGVYVSMPAPTFDERRQRSWSYARTPDVSADEPEPDLLFSFIGSPTSPCREPILALRHPHAVIEEVRDFMFWDTDQPNHEDRRERFRTILARSRFVLCPRGRGTSSIRLYETLAAGRVPVIISDEWSPPAGPDWESCSIRWPEGHVSGLVAAIEERDTEWPALSAAAAETYDMYFAQEVVFDRIVGLCGELQRRGSRPDSPHRLAIRSLTAAARERARGR